jgi:transcription elongation factor Elf1
MKVMKYFNCPHCNMQLENQNNFYPHDNENEFWCHKCGKIYIIEEDGSYIEEEDN